MRYPERQVLEEDDFVGLSIEGALVRPSVRVGQGRTAACFNPLVGLWTELTAEMKGAVAVK